ncbi:hypothetical protein E5Q_03682 [Mixia osmundae IAM 14324]|uniref:Uncharacterized protein n=1 Tax=Mixia osmundae (strain CBS 9802 / IAM 14324 / JCM 22182 / KY 12970) TaxID=764103 RepID=G7E2E8_MIXOS|nr:hypothetical protein E5Q_03682 [Mixia osmundae IAM 14324]
MASPTPESAAQRLSDTKPIKNIFSNDGSFLDKFSKVTALDVQQQREREALQRRKDLANRFKKRGKASAPPALDQNAKRAKTDSSASPQLSAHEQAYLREVANAKGASLKDHGEGQHSLLRG